MRIGWPLNRIGILTPFRQGNSLAEGQKKRERQAFSLYATPLRPPKEMGAAAVATRVFWGFERRDAAFVAH
jgi:hypothetical protein